MYRIAIEILVGDRLKYGGLLAGVAFAVMLMAQQAGIYHGIKSGTGGFLRDTAQGDLWVTDPQVDMSHAPIPIKSSVLQQVRGVPGVQWAVPLSFAYVAIRLPDGKRGMAYVVGLDDASLTGGPPLMRSGALADLRRDRAVLVPGERIQVPAWRRALAAGDALFIEDTALMVVGTYDAHYTFFWDPLVYTTYSRAARLVPGVKKPLSYVIVKLAPGAQAPAIARAIEASTGMRVRSNAEFLRDNGEYFMAQAGILVNFAFSVTLGLIIGAIVVGQTLYAFTLDQLRHYGALKAIGIGRGALVRMVLLQTLLVCLIGYGLGMGLALALGTATARFGLAFEMHWTVPVFALVAILLVGALASLISLRPVLRLEPAEVFRG